MIDFLKRLKFELWYYRNPPWDTGITPPELEAFIQTHPPGRALDLGCGTGTNVLSLVAAGWQVTGVDFSWRAVRLARRRLRAARQPADIRLGDVTNLDGLSPSFDLILDIGCFHQLDTSGRERYRRQIDRLLAAGGTFLLYAHCWREETANSHGIHEHDVEQFSRILRQVNRQDGQEGSRGPSVWLTYEKEK